MPAPVLRHDPSGIAPESRLGLDAPWRWQARREMAKLELAVR